MNLLVKKSCAGNKFEEKKLKNNFCCDCFSEIVDEDFDKMQLFI